MRTNDQPLQWYPGHMKKADRQIREKLKLIDVVIEVIDARVPYASRNPDIADYTKNKEHIIVLNKADMADPVETQKWKEQLEKEEGVSKVVIFNALEQGQRSKLINAINSSNSKNKNILKCLVVGIPNVGKSTIINSLIGKKKTQIGNKPGVTKGQQWLSTPDNFMLLDTPGILWPKFEDQEAAGHLAWIGSISDRLFEKENIAGDLGNFLLEYYPERLAERYEIEIPEGPAWMLFDSIAEARNLIKRGSDYDYLRTSEMLLNDFKNGRLGPITVDRADDNQRRNSEDEH